MVCCRYASNGLVVEEGGVAHWPSPEPDSRDGKAAAVLMPGGQGGDDAEVGHCSRFEPPEVEPPGLPRADWGDLSRAPRPRPTCKVESLERTSDGFDPSSTVVFFKLLLNCIMEMRHEFFFFKLNI